MLSSIMTKLLKLKLLLLWEYENTKMGEGLHTKLVWRSNTNWKSKKHCIPWTYVTSDFKGEEIDGKFFEKMVVTDKSKGI